MENYSELHEKARGVGLALDWQYKQPDSDGPQRWATLIGPEGASISISQVWNQKNRLQISANLPAGYWGSEKWPVISVSSSKLPAVIASDVKHRLLPAYLPLYKEAIARKLIVEERETADLVLTARLAAILGVKPRGKEIHWYGGGVPGVESMTLKVTNGQVSFDIRWIDPEKSEAILNVLKGKDKARTNGGQEEGN